MVVLTNCVSILCENSGGKIISPSQHLAKWPMDLFEQEVVQWALKETVN